MASKAIAVRRRASRRLITRRPRAKAKMTLPMAVIAGFVPTAVGVWNRRTDGTAVANYLQAGYTGLGSDGRFNLANLRVGIMPVLFGFGVHKIASMIGINRALGRSGIPFIRI